jgi:hypothetical protein
MLTVGTGAGSHSYLIDSGALVYVKDGNDYSLGSIQDLLDVDLDDGVYRYILNEEDAVQAMVVDALDAGAQSVFVMINSIAYGADGTDEFDVVKGLSFADGTSASDKTWNYTDSGLLSALGNPSSGRGRYSALVKFTLGEDGVLKKVDLLDGSGSSPDNYYSAEPGSEWTAVTVNSTNYNVSYITGIGNTANDGSFTLGVNDGTTTAAIKHVPFEANTVMYRISGGNWIAERPTTGNFNSNGLTSAQYVFVKTDDEKAYDVIIKVN